MKRKLYGKLEEFMAQHILNLNACITHPHPESIAFHERLGYKTVGKIFINAVIKGCGMI